VRGMEIIQPVADAFTSAAMIGALVLSVLIIAVLFARLMIDGMDNSV